MAKQSGAKVTQKLRSWEGFLCLSGSALLKELSAVYTCKKVTKKLSIKLNTHQFLKSTSTSTITLQTPVGQAQSMYTESQ